MKLAVVLVGYNRPDSMKRLFDSVVRSSLIERVDLIVSLDKSDVQNAIFRIVSECDRGKSRVIFRLFEEKQGLRKHILSCGDLTDDYDAVVVLEDDIVVSECFLNFVFSVLDYVGDNEVIAGISLYSPAINEMCLLPFVPKPTGFDNFYLQSAQSWGQCWTRNMWRGFRRWYDSNSVILLDDSDMPSRIYSWPETSWKKYYMKYLVESGRTFLYPYHSFSTNYSDVGQHNKMVSPHFQVPLVSGKESFHFGALHEVPVYDVFFERKGLLFGSESICCDIYGTKRKSSSRFLLSSKVLDAPVVDSYGLTFRPHEDNYLRKSSGCDIFLYDLKGFDDVELKDNCFNFKLANYHSMLSWRHSLIYGLGTLMARITQRFKRL